MRKKLGNIFRIFKKKEHTEEDLEELRLSFKERYHSFKLLLSANNSALEVMGAIDQALQGNNPFGMSFIRASSTAASVSVYKLIKHLNEISNNKYTELFLRFEEIQDSIQKILSQKKTIKDEVMVVPLRSVDRDMYDLVGSKMANIGEIKNKISLKVPPGFVITSCAYNLFIEHNHLQDEIDRRLQSVEADNIEELYTVSSKIQNLIINSKIPQKLEEDIKTSWDELAKEAGKEITVAMRSSAFGEDTEDNSFAGQYRSELNVSFDHIFDAYKEIIASKYSLTAITYRLNKGFKDEDIFMSVGCMVMVDAVCGGVMYSRSPLDINDDSIFINSSWGLPKTVVDGNSDCDLFVVSRKNMEITYRDIKNKKNKFVCYPKEGVCRVDITGENANLQSVSDIDICQLSKLAIKMEDHYLSPQDIEWAINQIGEVFILQCRPLKQMENLKIDYPEDLSNKENLITSGGITICPGVGSGKVVLVKTGADILSFTEGSVLVTNQALPRWASLLNRAKAVITEQGSFAGHFANVAREFRVPSIFGLKGILEKLNNGDIVTVDANAKRIYRGKVEISYNNLGEKKNFMEGSPVYETLREVSRLIVPLNLLDPDSFEFKPLSCKTFHDITRFAHEKSVHEMFEFGKTHNFSEKSSKQLFYKVPMQWWVLNLDDGFKEEVIGKYVHLDNIVSVPMLTIWDGIIAIPWDGPPIDGKGLMSVMFQATTNTSLSVGTRSKYTERNYFMISKNYCSLTSRLGFHFLVVESMISDRTRENYIRFQFKGGAADYNRRVRRVQFVGEVLEKYGFKSEVIKDTIICSLDAQEKDFMLSRLKIIGYITIHTRQLDMIMNGEARINYYRDKLHSDINKILS
ncbi:MAG: pyruvate, water dikinase [Desulfobacterales bacterium]|nr:pyruvate, water dikinase [Desulfobacterales bacterium]